MPTTEEEISHLHPRRRGRAALIRVAAASAFALTLSLGVYLLLGALRPDSGVISFAFLLVLPFAMSAFVAYVADPGKTRTLRFYLAVPVGILAAVILSSVFLLREGTICIVMLAPLWLASGLAGAAFTYQLRRRSSKGELYCSTVLLAPVLALLLEPLIPLSWSGFTVTRSAILEADAGQVWPLAVGIADVHPREGRWNFTQDVLGVPRPRGARLIGTGVGADRRAEWERSVRFRERITDWKPDRRIAWTFIFDDIRAWGFTDKHLRPESSYFRVVSGGYELEPLGASRTRLTLRTTYQLRTPVNRYAALWGQLFLGDVETNLLDLIKGRAEHS